MGLPHGTLVPMSTAPAVLGTTSLTRSRAQTLVVRKWQSSVAVTQRATATTSVMASRSCTRRLRPPEQRLLDTSTRRPTTMRSRRATMAVSSWAALSMKTTRATCPRIAPMHGWLSSKARACLCELLSATRVSHGGDRLLASPLLKGRCNCRMVCFSAAVALSLADGICEFLHRVVSRGLCTNDSQPKFSVLVPCARHFSRLALNTHCRARAACVCVYREICMLAHYGHRVNLLDV